MHRGLAMSNQNLKNIFFLLFYLFTFLPLKGFFTFLPLKSTTAGNTERSSDSCKEGYCNLQNCFPSIYFHIF